MERTNNNPNTVTEAEIDALLGEDKVHTKYHANHLITDKVVDPKSPNFGKKGNSYYLKNGDQWYFQPKMKVPEYAIVDGEEVETGKMIDNEEFFRVQWWQLESNVGEGNYGKATYKGLNASIKGKVGELNYTNKKWVFIFEDEKYNLVSPESVDIV